jgi:hypothetical protein
MASRARRQRQPFFAGPRLFSRTRRDIAELLGLLWLAVEISRFVRSKFTKAATL